MCRHLSGSVICLSLSASMARLVYACLLTRVVCSMCRNYHRIKINCDPAFDLNPTCYDNNTWFYVLHPSSSCVDAWDKTFNTTAPDILSQIAQVNLDAHQACTALTTEVRPYYSAHVALLMCTGCCVLSVNLVSSTNDPPKRDLVAVLYRAAKQPAWRRTRNSPELQCIVDKDALCHSADARVTGALHKHNITGTARAFGAIGQPADAASLQNNQPAGPSCF